MQKVRYEIDPHNRLVIDEIGKAGGLTGFRRVLDGRFRIDEENNLSYHVKAPLSGEEKIPNQIRLKGEWSLTDDHKLRLALDKSTRKTFGDKITIHGEILDAGGDSLLFAVTTTAKDGTGSTYALGLSGTWKADESNRLSFHVKREGGGYDILTFTGAWETGRNHEIIYRYEKARLLRKKRRTHSLTFKGFWEIRDAYRVSYVVSGGTDSAFDFGIRGAVIKDDYIKYEIGIAVSGRPKPLTRTVILSGRWSLKRDVGLVFEIEYGSGKNRAMVFGADARLTDRNIISFRLRNDIENRGLGMTLEISHKLLKGEGEAFLRLLASRREAAIYAGAAWQW